MANQLRWFPYSDTAINHYRIYRAITGIKVNFPNALRYGDQLIFAATSPTLQTVLITGSDITTVMNDINQKGRGVIATKSSDGSSLYIRCTAENDARFKLMRCAFATKTSQTPRVIAPRSEYEFLAEVPFEAKPDFTFLDPDGSQNDWYYITSVKNSFESIPSQALAPVPSFDETCAIVGRILTSGNEPVAGADIHAQILGPVGVNQADLSALGEEKISTSTDEEGRWTLSVTRQQLILLEIPSIGYNETVLVPDLEYTLFNNLKPHNDHYYNPTGEVAP